MKTKESMVSDLENKIEDEMSKAGVYSKGIEGMMAVNDFKNSLGEESEVDEKWTKKYKDSIDCKNPKGFSQKAHCQGKKKKIETDESTGAGSAGGFSAPLFSTTKGDIIRGGKLKESESKEILKGGLSDNKTLMDLAKKHAYDDSKDSTSKDKIDRMYKDLKLQLDKGIKVEMEHTKNKDKAREIAMGHLSEDPNYYTELKKIEATEATGASSSGQYSTTAAWAKSTNKKDWMGKSKPQIPGGKFVQVKKKCKKFPYCNQGDIKALKIYENESVKKAIRNISQKHNISENVIKSIISYEYEKLKSNK